MVASAFLSANDIPAIVAIAPSDTDAAPHFTSIAPPWTTMAVPAGTANADANADVDAATIPLRSTTF